jgi:hypothetical protein
VRPGPPAGPDIVGTGLRDGGQPKR